MPAAGALATYRRVPEAVGNAVKHSGCDTICVELNWVADTLSLSVADNGKYSAAKSKGLGLDSMRRRAESIGGTVNINSDENGGTEVCLQVKLK